MGKKLLLVNENALYNQNKLIHLFLCRDGFFFAVKEVSLLDQGSQAKQCIHQLEQVRHLKILFESHSSYI